MNNGLKIPVHHRLHFIRITVTLALIISFFLSIRLWGGNTLFPPSPAFENLRLSVFLNYFIAGAGILFLIFSLIMRRSRLFISLSLIASIALVLLDLNRLQPWFYVYNAILFVLLFYNGRVDDSKKYTGTFIFIQLIVASVYVYNGVSQINPYFIQGDYYNTVLPLSGITTDRQFTFIINAGKFVPYLLIFTGLGLLIRPVRYLAVLFAWLFHAALIILMFPSEKNSNYAIWFMNVAFVLIVFLLFSGQTKQKHFSVSFLFQRPLFYLLLFAFWIVPALNYMNYWPKSPTGNFMYSKPLSLDIANITYPDLPPYLKYFCSKTEKGYTLRAGEWCRHELHSECTGHASFNNILKSGPVQFSALDVKETEEELSSL